MTAEQAQDAHGVVLGTCLVNSEPAAILFDSGASHSFVTNQFVAKHNLPMNSMKTPLFVSSPIDEMKASRLCPEVNIKIMGIDFPTNLVVLRSWGIDVILGMDWLNKWDGVIQCHKKLVVLTSPQRDRIEFVATTPSKEEGKVNQVKGKYMEKPLPLEELNVEGELMEGFPQLFSNLLNLGTRFLLRGRFVTP
jgi:hypothetical protein